MTTPIDSKVADMTRQLALNLRHVPALGTMLGFRLDPYTTALVLVTVQSYASSLRMRLVIEANGNETCVMLDGETGRVHVQGECLAECLTKLLDSSVRKVLDP